MPASKRNTSFPHIGEESYKAFAKLIKRKKRRPDAADVSQIFDTGVFPQKEYRGIYYSYSSFLKLNLYMMIKGITNQSEMERHLAKNKKDRRKLGFKTTPDKTSINHFGRKYLDEEVKNQLEYAKSKIIEIAKEYKINLNPLLESKRGKPIRFEDDMSPSLSSITKRVCRKVKKKIMAFFPIELANKSIYRAENYFELLLYMSRENDFANNASATLRQDKKEKRRCCENCSRPLHPLSDFSDANIYDNYWICKNCGYEERICPDADTHFYHIKKKTFDWLLKRFQLLNLMIIREAVKVQQPENRTPEFSIHCNAGLDTTAWKTYPRAWIPDKGNRYFKGGKPEKGTFWGYEFITLDLVEHGKRFTVGALPVFPWQDIKVLAKQLLVEARNQKIFIDNLLADKGFFTDEFRAMLDRMKVRYLIPVKRDEEIKKLVEKHPVPWSYPDYHHGKQKTPYNMLIVEGKGCWGHHEDLKFAFSTNREILEVSDIEKIASMYPQRWGAETSIRIKKEDYLMKTTSKDIKVRLFYFLYTVLMYNLWYLSDLMVWLEIHRKVGTYRILKSKFFRSSFMNIMSDPG